MSSSAQIHATALVAQLGLAGIPAVATDDESNIVEANEAFLTVTAAGDRSPIGQTLADYLSETAEERGNFGDGAVYRVRGAAGIRWLRPQLQPGLATLQDVTNEWMMLSKLAAAVEVRDRLMRDAEIGMWRYDPDAEAFSPSEAILRRGGYAGPTSSLAETRAMLHPDDVNAESEVRNRIVNQGGSASCAIRKRKPNGGWWHMMTQLSAGRKLPSGKYEVYGLSHNITDLVEARDQAAVTHQRLEIAMSAARAGVYELDLRTSERWTSVQYQDLAGPEALARHSMMPFGMYHDDDVAAVKESWERCLRSNGVEWIDTRLYRPHGGEQWVRIFSRVQRNDYGVPIRAVGLMLDIQAQKTQEVALIEAKQDAEAATVAKSNFLASMSHEIRTPLNGVLGMAQALEAEELSKGQREKVGIILESGKTLTALLNDVLDISKIEAGKMEIASVDGEMGVTFERLRQLFLPRAHEKGLTIDLTFDGAIPERLNYDPVRVRQCVSNLLSNAIKFTERGRIGVKVSSEPTGSGGTMIRVEVSDSGIGMSEQVLSRLFTSFTQADASITRRFGGTGLGLAITRQLARLMGGDVTVESETGKGSTFTLSFLAAEAEGEGDEAAAVIEPPAATEAEIRRLNGLKVLLVDDNAVNRQVVRLFMNGFSPRFVEAVNGQEALDRLRDEDFDIVLLDVHMPVMDGREAIKRIRASSEHWNDIPVIALTADAMSGDREKYLALGMNDYVSKPIDQRELAWKLAKALEKRELLSTVETLPVRVAS